MKYSTIIFDWDGTVVDSTYVIVDSIKKASRELGFEEPTDQKASWVIGLSLPQALLKVVPGLTEARINEFVDAYRKFYFSADPDLKMFDGVLPLIKNLREQGLFTAVATGKSRFGLDQALKNHGIANLFDITKTADQTQSKPSPLMLEEIFAELMVDPEECVMVGDTSHDILMAKNAGCDSIAVSYGAHTLREISDAEPSYIAHNVTELGHLLSMYSRKRTE
ncbi:MAG: HAD-IA family hydrolase [Alcaligenaceae bacterium]|jgi:phosphoglycolate phosphatase|nr:HAD-IA family hydrolase [Alcaligenaceae bacterium]